VRLSNGAAGNAIRIRYLGKDSYEVELGFDDVVLISPNHKQSSPNSAYQYFNALGYELEIYEPAVNATFGRLFTETWGLCFFAAGLVAGTLPGSGTATYTGSSDGLAIINGMPRRLFGSAVSVSLNYATRTATVQIDLAGRDPAFGEFANAAPLPIGRATAQLTFAADTGYFADAPLAGPGGSTGSMTGQLFRQGNGAGFVYTLNFANGDKLIGSAAGQIPS
jgi:hypothetical protein